MSLMSPYYKLNLLLLLFILFASLAFVVHFFVPVVLQNFVLLQVKAKMLFVQVCTA